MKKFGPRQIAKKARLTPEEVRRVFDVLASFIDEGQAVMIPNFGTFRPEHLPAAAGECAGRPYAVPPGKAIRFRMSVSLKAAWRQPCRT